MTFPIITLPSLPPNTIVPEQEDLFISYLNRLYEDIAFCANNKDNNYFLIPVTDTPSDIPNLPNFGAYIVCVSGGPTVDPIASGDTLPVATYSLCKSDSTVAGQVTQLGFQAGTGTWAGNLVTITSTATNFQIAHDKVTIPVTIGNFNIRIVGTQN